MNPNPVNTPPSPSTVLLWWAALAFHTAAFLALVPFAPLPQRPLHPLVGYLTLTALALAAGAVVAAKRGYAHTSIFVAGGGSVMIMCAIALQISTGQEIGTAARLLGMVGLTLSAAALAAFLLPSRAVPAGQGPDRRHG